jgi:plastocyanin
MDAVRPAARRGEIVHPEVHSGRRFLGGCAALVSLLTVAACAPATSVPAQRDRATTRSPGSRQPGSTDTGRAVADCTEATKVTIVEKASTGSGPTYAFSPRTLTIRRGGFLAVTNKSEESHPLVSTPDAGIVSSVLDLKERQVIQFPKTGTFIVQSAAAARGAGMRVTVSGESGCDTPQPTLTITDGNSVTPAKLSVTATENFTVVNDSGTTQTMMCTPDPGGNRDNSRLDKGETQILAIDKPGRYTCASVQHPRAKATITVNGG